MEEILTPGAIGKIFNGDVRTEKEMMPVLQVTELRLEKRKTQHSPNEYSMFLSDGTCLLKAGLSTDRSNLVKYGILRAGSIVRLTRFFPFTQRSVDVSELVIISHSDIIGNPVVVEKLGVGYGKAGSEQQASEARKIRCDPGLKLSSNAKSPQGESVDAGSVGSKRSWKSMEMEIQTSVEKLLDIKNSLSKFVAFLTQNGARDGDLPHEYTKEFRRMEENINAMRKHIELLNSVRDELSVTVNEAIGKADQGTIPVSGSRQSSSLGISTQPQGQGVDLLVTIAIALVFLIIYWLPKKQ